MEEESSSKTQSCSSSNMEKARSIIKMVPLPDLVNPKLLHFDSQFELIPYENNDPCSDSQLQNPFPEITQPQQDLTFSPESQELLAGLDDPHFIDLFGPVNAPQLDPKNENDNQVNPDAFFDDFPNDMFDHTEPLPTPSDW